VRIRNGGGSSRVRTVLSQIPCNRGKIQEIFLLHLQPLQDKHLPESILEGKFAFLRRIGTGIDQETNSKDNSCYAVMRCGHRLGSLACNPSRVRRRWDCFIASSIVVNQNSFYSGRCCLQACHSTRVYPAGLTDPTRHRELELAIRCSPSGAQEY
jgi:hypothetical protein